MSQQIYSDCAAKEGCNRNEGVSDNGLIKVVGIIGMGNIAQRACSLIGFEQLEIDDLVSGEQCSNDMTEFVNRRSDPGSYQQTFPAADVIEVPVLSICDQIENRAQNYDR